MTTATDAAGDAGLLSKALFAAGMGAVAVGAVVGSRNRDDQPANPPLDTEAEHGQP